MTKTLTKKTFTLPKPIPGFSCLKMKDELQQAVLKKTNGMTSEEFCLYLQESSTRNPIFPAIDKNEKKEK